MNPPEKLYDGYIFDLDGTVYLGEALLPTSDKTIAHLRSLGKRVVFLSNNPTRSRAEYAAKLNRLGVPTREDEIINSSHVMVSFLSAHMPQAQLYVIGEQPLLQEIEAAGFELTEDPERIEAVIASFDRTFTYRKLQIAFDAVRGGARFFATNADPFCPVPGGGEPDAAAIIGAIEACTGVKVETVVGKPSAHTVSAVLQLLQLPAERCLIVGDRLETDVKMGLEAGMSAALTLTGAARKVDLSRADIKPTYVIRRLGELIPSSL